MAECRFKQWLIVTSENAKTKSMLRKTLCIRRVFRCVIFEAVQKMPLFHQPDSKWI